MIAIIYDPGSGTIRQTIMGTEAAVEATAAALGLDALEIEPGSFTPEAIDALDATHRVTAGKLEPISDGE